MAKYQLSEKAVAEILAIDAYTTSTFGAYQADAYQAGLEHTFNLLADFPLMGPSAETLFPGLRRFRFQSHTIFYSVAPDMIFIRQILHVRMQVRPDLFA